MQRLIEIMRRLRAPGGCPWDQEQTHESLRPHLIEEAAEAVDALGHGSTEDVVEELGDVLLQVAFHAVIGQERDAFTFDDIEDAIVTKLVRRHPHVFGSVSVDGSEDVVANWEAIKAEERRTAGKSGVSPADAVPRSLPSLKRAAALDKALGWTLHEDDLERTIAHAAERPETLGAMLIALAQVARRAGIDPEIALRDAVETRSRGPESRPHPRNETP